MILGAIKMNKKPNWHVNLGELANDLIGEPFEWGKTDCVSIARAALVAQFGEDPCVPYVNVTYTTKTGATRAFNKIGNYASILEKIGAREIAPHNVRDGDIAVFKPERGYENVMTMMGGSWILSDPFVNKIVAVRPVLFSYDENIKVYRIV